MKNKKAVNKPKGLLHICYYETENEQIRTITDFLNEHYNGNFKYAYFAQNDQEFCVVSTDFNWEKDHFSAKYDAFVFDLNGKNTKIVKSAITGPAYSDFFVENVKWAAGIGEDYNSNHFVVELRYVGGGEFSKCDDTYIGYAQFVPTTTSGYFKESPFLFVERSSERGYPDPENRIRTCGNRRYCVLNEASKNGHNIEEICKKPNLFDELWANKKEITYDELGDYVFDYFD